MSTNHDQPATIHVDALAWVSGCILGSPPLRQAVVASDEVFYLLQDAQKWTNAPPLPSSHHGVMVDGRACVTLATLIAMVASSPHANVRGALSKLVKDTFLRSLDDSDVRVAVRPESPYSSLPCTRPYSGEDQPALLLEWLPPSQAVRTSGEAHTRPLRLVVPTEPRTRRDKPRTSEDVLHLAKLFTKGVRRHPMAGFSMTDWKARSKKAMWAWLWQQPASENPDAPSILQLSMLVPVNRRWVKKPLAWALGLRGDADKGEMPITFRLQPTRAPGDNAPMLHL